MKWRFALPILATVVVASSVAQAALTVRGVDSLGNQLIYDSTANVTWYDYTNRYGSQDYELTWASALVVSYDGQTLDDWRLPHMMEFNQLWYNELPNRVLYPQSDWASPFQHLGFSAYWCDERHPQLPNVYGMVFFTNSGDHLFVDRTASYYGMAVRAGDVPEPATLSLLGLGGLAMLRWRRQKT